MKKLPVAGPTYDYKLENIRNSIIEEELALTHRKLENIELGAGDLIFTDDSGNQKTVRTLQTAVDDPSTGLSANATAISSLETRVTSAEGTITANSTSITSLQSDLTTAEGNITANATAVSSLDTRVTTAEGNITSQASDITTLQSDLSALDTDVTANATAVSSLSTQVSTIDGEVTSLASDVTSLTTTVGSNTTSISTNASSINGIEGKYAVKINNNGHVSGFGLISTANNATPTSTFTVTADAFKIVDTSGAATPAAPFSVYTSTRTVDGVTVPAGVYMDNAFITSAEIKTLNADVITVGTLDADRINIDGVTLDTSGGQLIVAESGIGTTNVVSRAITDQTSFNSSSATFTSTGSTTLGSFTTTEASQFILVNGSCNIYGTGTGTAYSLALTIDGTTVSLFTNSTNDDYANYNDLRFGVSTGQKVVVASAGTHTVGLSYVIQSGSSLKVSNFYSVVTLLKR